MPDTTDAPLFLNGDELCKRYSLSRQQLRQITARWDSPPYVTLGLRIVRYEAAVFDRWFRAHSSDADRETTLEMESADTS